MQHRMCSSRSSGQTCSLGTLGLLRRSMIVQDPSPRFWTVPSLARGTIEPMSVIFLDGVPPIDADRVTRHVGGTIGCQECHEFRYLIRRSWPSHRTQIPGSVLL